MMPEFGKWYAFRAETSKVTDRSVRRLYRREYRTPQQGVFIGTRTLAEGTLRYDSSAEGYYLKPDRYVKVCLFVTAPNRNPIYVMPEDVIEEDA